MMSRPGERRIERLAICARCLLELGTDLTYLLPYTLVLYLLVIVAKSTNWFKANANTNSVKMTVARWK